MKGRKILQRIIKMFSNC